MESQKSFIEVWDEMNQTVQYWDGDKFVDDISAAFAESEDVICRIVPEAEKFALINIPFRFRLCTVTNGQRKYHETATN